MKFLIVFMSFWAAFAFAQSADIKVKDVNASEGTTIKIEKGGKADAQYEITEGSDEITGDPAPLLNDARTNWKSACAEWKKETKELNKENQVLTLNCGRMECSTTAMETTCRSMGKHKLKVKIK